MTGRIEAAFARAKSDGRPVLGIYLVAGHPDLETSVAHMEAAIDAGADMLEIGIPFSDPAADGPVIQAATSAALRAGVTVDDALEAVAGLRWRRPDTPLVAMTYANILHRMGWDTAAERFAGAGFDGVILPDVPLEESRRVRDALAVHGLAWVPLVTPTTDADRMQAIAQTATGFLYVVGNVGTTGRADPGPLVEATVGRAKATGAEVPLAVGFGLSRREDVERVHAAGADGAIVGSAVVGPITDGATPDVTGQAVAVLAGTNRP